MDTTNPTNEGKPVGYKNPPKNRQFGQPEGNPRNPGCWRKEDTPRFKLEQMMKLQELELQEIAEDVEAPLFERKLATAIMKGRWREIEAMMNQVYGQPKQTIDTAIVTPVALTPVKPEDIE